MQKSHSPFAHLYRLKAHPVNNSVVGVIHAVSTSSDVFSLSEQLISDRFLEIKRLRIAASQFESHMLLEFETPSRYIDRIQNEYSTSKSFLMSFEKREVDTSSLPKVLVAVGRIAEEFEHLQKIIEIGKESISDKRTFIEIVCRKEFLENGVSGYLLVAKIISSKDQVEKTVSQFRTVENTIGISRLKIFTS